MDLDEQESCIIYDRVSCWLRRRSHNKSWIIDGDSVLFVQTLNFSRLRNRHDGVESILNAYYYYLKSPDIDMPGLWIGKVQKAFYSWLTFSRRRSFPKTILYPFILIEYTDFANCSSTAVGETACYAWAFKPSGYWATS